MQRSMRVKEIMEWMEDHKNQENLIRFGSNTKNAFGIDLDELRKYAKYKIRPNHQLALDLWDTGRYEPMLLASLLDEEAMVDEDQMDNWVTEFDSWDFCDQVCMNLFAKTGYAYIKAEEWAEREEEFIKRAGFVLMAILATHDKRGSNKRFLYFLELVKKSSEDDRNYVKKAVNWALKQIGKRNKILNSYAMETAGILMKMDNETAKWIGSNALKELERKEVQKNLED